MTTTLLHPATPILIQESRAGLASRWLRFRRPLGTLVAQRLGDVEPLVAELEAAVGRGLWAAGFLAYEAAPAFDPALEAHPPGDLPLAWWGLFEAPEEAPAPGPPAAAPGLAWRPAIDRRRYRRSIERIRALIERGDTYQVNYTFPLEAPFAGDPAALHAALHQAQQGRYGAYLDLGRFAVCSVSPELFFELSGDRLLTRPMKGTAPRGRYPQEDARRSAELRASAKERAENLMIVDMMRNDLGRIARPGSVRVEELFAVETYPTLHQLTSTVGARSDAPLLEILSALFPSASITGAPKVRTSAIIRELETGPRGVYTGAIGFLAPGRRAQLSVAIRTATVDRRRARVRYGTGGGIVWDSRAESEYEECRTKAKVLGAPTPRFSLLETLAWRPRSGYFLLARHLERLEASARYFDFRLDRGELRRRLDEAAAAFEPVRHRVRLVAGRDGGIALSAEPWPCSGRTTWSVGLADRPVDSSDPMLFHKTTRRALYERARASAGGCDEAILWNERGELTESTRANLVVELEPGGELLTPALDCGLLPGTYRAELLERGRIREAVLPVEALARAERVLLVNSLRGWIRTRRPAARTSGGGSGSVRMPAPTDARERCAKTTTNSDQESG